MTHCGESSAGPAQMEPTTSRIPPNLNPLLPQSLPCLPGLLLLSLSHPNPSRTRQTHRRDSTTKRLPEQIECRTHPGPSRADAAAKSRPGSRSWTRSGQAGVSASRLPATAPHPVRPATPDPCPPRTAWLAATAATAAARIGGSSAASVGQTCGAILARQRRRAGGPRRAGSAVGVLRRPDLGRRPGSGAPRPTWSWLAIHPLQGHLRAGQPRPVA